MAISLLPANFSLIQRLPSEIEQTMESEVVNNDMMSDDENLKIDGELVHEEAKFELILVKEPSESVVARHMFDEMPDSQNCHKHKQLVELSVCISSLNQDGCEEACFDPGGEDMLSRAASSDLQYTSKYSGDMADVVATSLLDSQVIEEVLKIDGALIIDEKPVQIDAKLEPDLDAYQLFAKMPMRMASREITSDVPMLTGAGSFAAVLDQPNLLTSKSDHDKVKSWTDASKNGEVNFDPGGGFYMPSIDLNLSREENFPKFLLQQPEKLIVEVNIQSMLFDPGGQLLICGMLELFVAMGKTYLSFGAFARCALIMWPQLRLEHYFERAKRLVFDPGIADFMFSDHASYLLNDVCYVYLVSAPLLFMPRTFAPWSSLLVSGGIINKLKLATAGIPYVHVDSVMGCTRKYIQAVDDDARVSYLHAYMAATVGTNTCVQLAVLVNRKAWQKDPFRCSLSLNAKTAHVSSLNAACVFGLVKESMIIIVDHTPCPKFADVDVCLGEKFQLKVHNMIADSCNDPGSSALYYTPQAFDMGPGGENLIVLITPSSLNCYATCLATFHCGYPLNSPAGNLKGHCICEQHVFCSRKLNTSASTPFSWYVYVCVLNHKCDLWNDNFCEVCSFYVGRYNEDLTQIGVSGDNLICTSIVAAFEKYADGGGLQREMGPRNGKLSCTMLILPFPLYVDTLEMVDGTLIVFVFNPGGECLSAAAPSKMQVCHQKTHLMSKSFDP